MKSSIKSFLSAEYYKIVKSKQQYKGVRYFKMQRYTGMDYVAVVQVCVHPGTDERRGRGNVFGIYLIHSATFFANYLSMKYAVPCTKAEYQKNFKTVLSHLQ